ncbi:phage terminase small subunit P27 family [Rhodanobacter lindaniclasticus]
MAKKSHKPHLRLVDDTGIVPVAAAKLQPLTMTHCPTHLDKRHKAAWKSVLERAIPGTLSSADAEVVTAYVVASIMHADATATLAREGMTYTTPNGLARVNPAIRVQMDATSAMLRAASALGFTPKSRKNIRVSNDLMDVADRDGGFGQFAEH